ncbi:hypothetical protein NQ318_008508 [Aromia moschata]|uniref:SET domain-containing protein n=1 Tax=Aromia moschata TaxID=1265417 RepID=A0AAV8X636_9CUCU|nr:hypothetical protein NQ318_008508 [Aromia moschata]
MLFSSRYNHSCVSNCLLYFCGTKLVMMAVNPIGKGEQCTVTYGWNYWSHDFMDRRLKLQEYCFTCSCKACIGKWPNFADKVYDNIIANYENFTDNDVRMCAELFMVLKQLHSDLGNDTWIERSLSTCFKWQPSYSE